MDPSRAARACVRQQRRGRAPSADEERGTLCSEAGEEDLQRLEPRLASRPAARGAACPTAERRTLTPVPRAPAGGRRKQAKQAADLLPAGLQPASQGLACGRQRRRV